ncbi:MAG: major facilitator superfamily domain-containing protein 6 [Anaerolineales bacterium]
MKKMFYPFSFYFLFYAAMAFFMPFIVLFYQQLHFTGVQIGLLTGVPPLVSLIAGPLLSGVADSKRRHNLIMGVGLLSAAVTAFLLPNLTSFLTIFILVIVFNIFFAPVGALSDSATMAMLGDERSMYGRVRLGGTIGWGVFAQIAGALMYAYGLNVLFYVYAGITVVNLVISQKLIFGKHEEHEAAPGGVRTFLTNRRWIFFLLTAFFGGLGSISVASYLSPYLAELGANGKQIGFALTIAAFTEFPIFFFGNRLVKRFTPKGLFLIGLILIGIRSLSFGIVNSVPLAIVVQAIGGMTFPIMWSAGVAYADENAPAGLKSTAQALFGAASFGVGSTVGGLICGVMLESIGGRGMFLVLGIIILVGLALVEGVQRLLPEKAAPELASSD